MINCTPNSFIRQENNHSKQTCPSSNSSFYNWSSDEDEEFIENTNKATDNNKFYYDKKNNNYSRNTSNNDNLIKNYNLRENSRNNPPAVKSKKLSQKAIISKKLENPFIKNECKNNKLYKVKKGDNLLKIAKKFNTDINEIMKINKIKENDTIQEDMILKISENKIEIKSTQNDVNNTIQSKNPYFCWPIKHVYGTKRDGLDGVKSIGIFIMGEPDTTVFSSAEGIVTKVGYMRGFGNYIILTHINKYLTIYSNLKDIKVCEGEKIQGGKSIGKVEGNKLHFQIGHSGKPEDPFKYLSKKS
jgi:LysM repeat protein